MTIHKQHFDPTRNYWSAKRGPSQEATFQDASNKEATGFLVIHKATTKNDHKATGVFLVFKTDW